MALGFLLIYLLLISPIVTWLIDLVVDQQPFVKIILGLLIFLGTIGLGGAVAGAWGGLAISRFSKASTKKHFLWRGALSFFLAHLLVVIPAIALIFAISFFNPDIDVSSSKLPRLILLIGLLYGLVSGLLFGLLTAGLRRFLLVVLAAMAGFGLGGLLFGFVLRFAADWDPGFWRVVAITFGFFLFGAAGGALLGFIYRRFEDEQSLFPDSRFWKIVRGAAVAVLLTMAAFAFYNLLNLVTINIPEELAEQLSLPTVSTHWLPVDGAVPRSAVPAETSSQISCINGTMVVSDGDGMVTEEDWAPCFSDPIVAEAADGRVHAIWYSDQVRRALDGVSQGHFLMETILDSAGWTDPAIIARPTAAVEPRVDRDADGTLYLEWDEGDEQQVLSMTPYSCDELPAGDISQIVYEVVRQEQFRNPDDPVAFCDNRFDRLHFTPNPAAPDQPFSNTPLGAFDTVADVVREAEYEVLFVTMQWDAPSEYKSPGDALTQAIADLHEKVKANPENYPRGMTVRIMLGNLPETTLLSFSSQLHHVITDLKDAGLDVGQDAEIGWTVELADYTGSLPHAHSKFLVVDGKTAVAAGFNYSYLHLEENHPQGDALGMTDMGLQMTGPVAQTVMAAYDDLWRNSERIKCPGGFVPSTEILFTLLCRSEDTEDTHPPEVLRFYPAEENDNSAFALHHTLAHLESDEALLAAIGAAQESIDLFEVNFSLESVCLVLAQVSDLCSDEDFAPPYMIALRDAILINDVHVRVMMEESAMNGIENRAGILWLTDELAGTGKEDNLDLRFSSNKMHNKAMLVDEEFLSVGSQNFHFSAWGSPSLTEYNLATDDPLATEEFLTEFEYWWTLAIPVEDVMGQNSPEE